MSKAEEIIKLRNAELSAQCNSRSLWQSTAYKIYPYAQITSIYEPGVMRTDMIYDITPMLDCYDMVSGLKQILIPSGQPFFALKTNDKMMDDITQRYLGYVTEGSHEQMYSSNFITEFDEVLRNLIVFGPASLYSEWTPQTGLNYKAMVVGSFLLIENSKKIVDGIIITMNYTVHQAIEEFGDKAGKSVMEAKDASTKQNEMFEYIYIVRKRNTNPALSQKYSTNMPYESCIVNVKDKEIVEEGGYPEFPYPTARWMRPGNEKDGRGIGTEILPQIRVLNQMMKDFIECGNKWNNPPRQVHERFEGQVRVTPGAVNVVPEMDMIRALDMGLNGNFPITEKQLEQQREIIHRAFYKNAFSPLEDLTGDRRTTLEIRERIRQTWHRIGPPVARIWTELLQKTVERSIMLLIRNGVLDRPPMELQGKNFGIEFVGPFALELRSQQAKAFQEWVSFVGQMETVFPGAVDNVDSDDAIIRMGRTFGVNNEDMASAEERDAKRQARMEQQQAMMAMQAAESAGKTYKDATSAPEENSAAAQLMGV